MKNMYNKTELNYDSAMIFNILYNNLYFSQSSESLLTIRFIYYYLNVFIIFFCLCLKTQWKAITKLII